MRKWIIAAVVLVLVVVLCAVAVGNLNTYLNRNREWIAEQVESALGRKVGFTDIGVTLRGGLGVRVMNLNIADDPSFSDESLLRADSALVRVRILPALFGRYEVARVVLEHPAVSIVRTGAGLNVSALGGAKEQPPAETEESAPPAFVVAYIDIDDGQLRYVDRTAKPPTQIEIDQLDFSASDVSLSEPLAFDLAAAALGARRQNVRIEGRVGPLGAADPESVPIDVEMRIESISTEDLARIPEIAKALPPDLATSGPVSLTAMADGTFGELRLEATLDASGARVKYGSGLDKPDDTPLRFVVGATRKQETVEISEARLTFHTAEIGVKGDVDLGEAVAYDVAVTSNIVPLRGWNRILPALDDYDLGGTVEVNLRAKTTGAKTPALRGTVMLTDLAASRPGGPKISDLSTTATFADENITIEPAKFRIGDSPATLSASVTSLEKPNITFVLASDALRADSLGLAGDEPADTEQVLRDFNLDGSVRMTERGAKVRAKVASASGNLRGMAYQNLAADVRLDEGRAVLNPISMAAFGGTLRGEGIYDMRDEEQPSFNFESQVQGLRIGDVVASFLGAASQVLEGNIDADLSLAGSGAEWDTISKALVGGGRIGVRDGVVKDLNLVDGVLQGLVGVPGLSGLLSPELRQKYPRLFAGKDTFFDALEGRVSVANGKLTSDNIALRAADFAVKGSGGVGFDRSIDVSAAMNLSQQLSEDLIARVGAAKYLTGSAGRIEIPFRLDGTLPGVRPRPDLDFVSHAVQRAAVRGFVDSLLPPSKQSPAESATPSGPDSAAEQDAPAAKSAEPAPAKTEGEKPREPQPPSTEEQIRRGLEGLLGR